MRIDYPLRGKRLSLRTLDISDATEKYVSWLSDTETNRYLEVRFSPPRTIQDLAEFINACNEDPNTLLLGIFLNDTDRHIGNIKLGPINRYHRRADIGLVIGEKDAWGRGYASEAIASVSEFALKDLGLEKLSAGCYDGNIGSLRAFLKVGYQEEGRQIQHWEAADRRQDEIHMGLTAARLPRRLGHVDRITLIGGGPLLVDAAHEVRTAGYQICIVLAPRHAEENLGGRTVMDELLAENFDVSVVDDINGLQKPPGAGPSSLALCFGSPWIFSRNTRTAFGAGMFNVNLIPMPRYVGGAHFTWQILNQSKEAGCILQEISDRIDRGPILRRQLFEIPLSATKPVDYFSAYAPASKVFLREILVDMRADHAFLVSEYLPYQSARLYFPRLNTLKNGWIDWSWTSSEIALFCNAFDTPYHGARTLSNGKVVCLTNVTVEVTSESNFHPFCSGLVVRRTGGSIWVAAKGGLLRIGQFLDDSGKNQYEYIKEGDRLFTTAEILQNALCEIPKISALGIVN